jgi:MFS family permease
MLWLIIARGLSGIGGGGIVNSVWVITTEIVPPGTQAKWSQALSVTWSASAISGPILGGLFTGESRGYKPDSNL